MAQLTTVTEIERLGFEWPKFPAVESHCVAERDRIDLHATLEKLRSSKAFYQRQLVQAFNFKARTGADYSDFTDRHDEYARSHRELKAAVSYIEQIIEQLG